MKKPFQPASDGLPGLKTPKAAIKQNKPMASLKKAKAKPVQIPVQAFNAGEIPPVPPQLQAMRNKVEHARLKVELLKHQKNADLLKKGIDPKGFY